MRGWRAQANVELGRWSKVTEDAGLVLNSCREIATIRIPSLTALGLLHIRRGESGSKELLDEARDLAEDTGELQRLAPVAAARAEARWWQGERGQVKAEVTAAFEMAVEQGHHWAIGELGYWLWRVGALAEVPLSAAQPYLLHMRGDWRAAAAAWEELGCPYQRALACSDGDAEAQMGALVIFEALGAGPAAESLRQKLRDDGVRGIPRGPRSDTLEHPSGLTSRQWEVLSLLVQDMSNDEIAQRLHISPKTAGHHVSAILAKLEVQSRQGAALLAVQRGWFVIDR
jgi:DNA-binding CsgD family transcriptional regulator